MKKIFLVFFTIISFFMMGCSQKESFDVSKITPPESDNIKILGKWKVVSKLHDSDENNSGSVSDAFHLEKDDIVNISKDDVVVNGINIVNPNFKLKRMEREIFFKEIDNISIKNEIKDEIKNEYIDVNSIYDSNKTYLSIISINDDEAYLLLTDNLIKLKKISNEGIKEDSNESNKLDSDKSNKRENKISTEYYQKDVGILLGLKEPANIEDDDFEEASYKTLWISVINNELQPVMVLDKSLLLPRINGFSNISLSSTLDNGKFENKLKVTSKKKDPNDKTEVKGEKNTQGIYEEITFVGNDYIGLESYSGHDDFRGTFNAYNIIPINTMNSNKSMDILNLFGKEQEENFNKSENNAIQKYDINGRNYYSKNKYSNITLQRKNGNWHLEGILNEKNLMDYPKTFDININPVPILVNYDTLAVPWSQVLSLGKDVRDVVTAPNGKIAIILAKDKLSIYKVIDGRIGERLGEINIKNDEKIVMAEWAIGDYVKCWDETVENVYGAKKTSE
ncbi:hypothetical protein C5S25_01020 [Clostridium perfringens]|uniref:hypothetical protein n=1 Tax=Clostridium perfringens TaxID=1502 RepID=UPI000E1884C9|nr:hypothetical protein [Clostridium perfringens]UBK57879.1 hypothetical protein KLF43_11355 [Clostridium perfringens]UBL08867.1 hypothetical protein KLF39_11325 [Clostridium perfringens]SUY35282.1 putative lipoprotein [Clostridium perfringens]VTQ67021.1 putative lipoprotein [Clostridium perfringens]HAT4140402.1 hypothetical protein [Clostridium perfringens]